MISQGISLLRALAHPDVDICLVVPSLLRIGGAAVSLTKLNLISLLLVLVLGFSIVYLEYIEVFLIAASRSSPCIVKVVVGTSLLRSEFESE